MYKFIGATAGDAQSWTEKNKSCFHNSEKKIISNRISSILSSYFFVCSNLFVVFGLHEMKI
jgi:hypothetical protein